MGGRPRCCPRWSKATVAAGPARAGRRPPASRRRRRDRGRWPPGSRAHELDPVERYLARASLARRWRRWASRRALPAPPTRRRAASRHCPRCGGPPQLSVRRRVRRVAGERAAQPALRPLRHRAGPTRAAPARHAARPRRRGSRCTPSAGTGRSSRPGGDGDGRPVFPHLRIEALLDLQPVPDRRRPGARRARRAGGRRAGGPAARPLRRRPGADERSHRISWGSRMATEITPGKAYGFFTDTSVCIGCKACEVACKEWNQLPGNEPASRRRLRQHGQLDAQNWRHVKFIDNVPDETMSDGQRQGLADDVGRVQALPARELHGRLPHRARSSAPSSTPSTSSRTSATAAATASPPARTA